ncbi:MAG: hypothetical protein XU10_C0020G0017 [Chloroflexi bacterium CSP1-4]|nr:MAG: hypothetical protein XU10_C0020G0017 [Chloroflexi bacterium CSP1-4]
MKPPRTPTLGSLVLLVALIAGGCSIIGPTPLPPDSGVTSPPGGGGGVAPGEPRPQLVIPRPGQLNVHLVAITKLTVTVSGRAVTVQADWVSGVEPCYVLDSVKVTREDSTFTVALFEGTSDPNAACIEIAAFKATTLQLGDLEPGTYTIQPAQGDARPVAITVQ